MIVSTVLSIICGIIGNNILVDIWALAVLLPSLAVLVRRLHDIGKKWTWMLMSLIPVVGWIIVIVYCCRDSQPGDNQFGPNPKGV